MRSLALVAVGAMGLLFQLGCGRSAEERQLDSMRDEIDRIREARDHADTTAAPQGTGGTGLVVPTAYASAPRAAPPPPPATLQLGSGADAADDSAEDDPQDPAPRPTIRVFGTARAGHATRRSDDRIERTGIDEGSSAPDAPDSAHAIDPEAKRAYDAALALVNAKRFDRALDALAAFLVKWPDHPYANNAMYWRGECYFARGDYSKAAEQFEGVLRRFPAGSKAPDSLLKLGMSQQKLGNTAGAKECFDRLAQQYPDSEAARRIPALPNERTRGATPPGPAQESQP